MSVTYTIPVQRLGTTVGGELFTSLEQTTIALTYDPPVSTAAYGVIGIDPESPFPLIEVRPEENAFIIDGRTVDQIENSGFDIFTYFGQLQWSGGTSYILAVEEYPFEDFPGAQAFESFAVIGGAPLPTFPSANAASLFLFENQGGLSAVPAGTPFSEGAPIPFEGIPDVQVSGAPPSPPPPPSGPTPGPDDLTGGPGPDDIDALAGNDTVDGGGGNDTLDGNAGDDSILGGQGNDSLIDGTGRDTIRGGAGNDTIDNTGGTDLFDGGAGRDLLISDVTGLDPQGVTLLADLAAGVHGRVGAPAAQQDTLIGIEDFITIGDWNAQVTGSAIGNALTTGAGSDTVRGGGGDDTVESGAGDDALLGQAGNDSLSGGLGNDLLDGGPGNDTLQGGAGNDTLIGREGNDQLAGGAGSDVYVVDAGDTVIEALGGAGVDEVRVSQNATIGEGIERLVAIGNANVRLDGSAGAEALVGNSGNNILVGFGGEDTMTGGAGADSFALTAQRGTDPDVLISDWGRGADRLAIDDQLVGLGARGIDIRELTMDDFRTLRDAGSVGYNFRNGELALDIDGDGDREVVATLEGGARIGLDDILLF